MPWTTAAALAVSATPECFLAWTVAVRTLMENGVIIRMVDTLPPDKVGVWDSATSTLEVRDSAPIEDKMWVLQQLWAYRNLGPDASPWAHREPVLRVVPPPRISPDRILDLDLELLDRRTSAELLA